MANQDTPFLWIRSPGWYWILGSGIPALGFYGYWIVTGSVWGYLFVPAVALCLFLGYFFRDPPRQPEESGPGIWLSPADGIVSRVETTDSSHRLVIFLTVFNVHVNRMPVNGRLKQTDYHEGQFLAAFHDEVLEKNERARHLCEDESGNEFEVWQIAGFLARTIQVWLDSGEQFFRGDRFGMISLGSRTDLVFPEDVKPVVEEGDLVRGGQTVVGRRP